MDDFLLVAQQTELIKDHGFAVYVAVILLGGLVALSGWLVKWFAQEHTRALKSHTNAVNLQTISIMKLQQQLLTHDLTVRGLNPTTGGSPEERDARAYSIYKEIQSQMESLAIAIKEMSS